MQLVLSRRMARNTAAQPDDIRALKKALNRLGYYLPDAAFGITRITEEKMIDALRNFQRDQNLPADSVIVPQDDTAKALDRALAAQAKNQSVTLRWHSAKDKNSCAACIAHDGTIVTTDEENTPGCPGTCRCWVTPVKTDQADPDAIEAVYPIENLLFAAVASHQ